MKAPIPDSAQLDLFLHSGVVALANNVADALFARDAARAAECLDRLRADEPEHQTCKALETLCQVLREWPLPSTSPAEIDKAIQRLETDAHPAAFAAMGDKAAEFIRGLWRDLAQSGSMHIYDSACHCLDPYERSMGAWFPAWHLVEHPGIRIDCGAPATLPATRPAQAFVAIARLLDLEKHGYSNALISARGELRSLDPDMFDFYMARRHVIRR